MEGSLLPRVTLLLLLHARRWEALSHRRTAPPSRMQEVGSSSRCRIAPPPSHQEEASLDESVEMWVVAPPPPTCLVAPPSPPLTFLKVASSSNDSPSDSSGYKDECPHVKEVNSYELLLDFNYLVQLLNVYTFIFRFKS
jgi:hypothetical protein